MNNCGKRFHGEVAKFRFLNELIKVLTPKVMMETEVSLMSGSQMKNVWFFFTLTTKNVCVTASKSACTNAISVVLQNIKSDSEN